MGKLGGGELNFSSDIDLVLLYPQAGETDGARLDQQPGVLHAPGAGADPPARAADRGRLRVSRRSAAAPVWRQRSGGRRTRRRSRTTCRCTAATGSATPGSRRAPSPTQAGYAELFRSAIQPFVYRRYLDFGVFESLREMKALIEREVQRRELADNIKLGDGGIREIEFIVQSFQLIRGGQDRRLQSTLAAPGAGAAGRRQAAAGRRRWRELDAAYVFLRRLENRLQMRADQQVHQLPADALERERLAAGDGHASRWTELRAAAGAPAARASRRIFAPWCSAAAERAGRGAPRIGRCRSSMTPTGATLAARLRARWLRRQRRRRAAAAGFSPAGVRAAARCDRRAGA